MVEGLIDMSKLQLDKFTQSLSWFNPKDLIDEVLGTISFMAQVHNVEMKNLACMDSLEIYSDKHRI